MKIIGNRKQLLENLDRGTPLPANFYLDPEILQLEMEIFRHSWLYVGPTQQLKAIGDRMTGYLGDIPIVIVRNRHGLEGFLNVCRHRRSQIVPHAKVCKRSQSLQCPFHFWTYDLTGALKCAPGSDKEKQSERTEFKREDHSLLPIQVGTLGPWVFANADLEAESLESYFGDVVSMIESAGLDLQTLNLWEERTDWEYPANWKIVMETNVECYHCRGAHPGLNALLDMDGYELMEYRWFSKQIGKIRPSASPACADASKMKVFDPHGPVREAQSYLLWPGTTIEINPNQTHPTHIAVSQPKGLVQTIGFNERYFGADVDTQWARAVIEFDDRVWLEDAPLVKGMQSGLSGGQYVSGRWFEPDRLCVHFQKLLVQELSRLQQENGAGD